MEINEKAPVLVRKQILVNAPAGKIWNLLTDVNQWKFWQPEVKDPVLEGPFEKGSIIRYKALMVSCALTVLEAVPTRHLAWTGESAGKTLLTIWNLEEVPGGILVKADSTFDGRIAWLEKFILRFMTERVLRGCLLKLKAVSELS
jgi:hypothetical protein